MKDLSPILKSLGLAPSEIKTYLAAFDRGPSTVADLARATSLSKPAVYGAIAALKERGILGTVVRGKKRLHSVEHPQKLASFARRREEEMRETAQELGRMEHDLELKLGGDKPVVEVFEGKEGLLQIIEELKQIKQEKIYELTDLNALNTVLSIEELAALRAGIKKNKIRVVGMYSGKNLAPRKQWIERKQLPKNWEGKLNVNIIATDKDLFVLSLKGKMPSIIIRDGTISKAIKFVFSFINEKT